ncbi:TPA: restriction endonuclease subunit S [Citrobacter freundii]|jgi:type I restriction enzyme S subunit|nr:MULTISPECIES: restriction endonuclease subunit S [Enterobacterales]MEB1032097.1 restriction endonuclease subunit S [Citrobacter youngae]MEB1080608.1 restriction endonuclease subunit S [Citrobacter portucalensis]MEB2714980.1 restriction endonuclease subunit S [Citrobacter freundii]MEB2763446.1 restriction endonuclease subunit S [Citrobacter freundii]BDT25231.1 type I restriction endonuclease [Citrobacter freundii]
MMVPKLRFKEFNTSWNQEQIGNILTIGSGRDYKHLSYGEVPVFGTGGLMTYVDEFLHNGETVCIGRKGTIDKPFYYSGKIWTVDTLFFTHSFTKVLPKFVLNLFLNINWKEHNEASGVPSLSKSTIEKIEVFYPDSREQTKIADFFSAIDEKIILLNKQYDLLCQYKKGMMQKIFSQELRFKDESGEAFPEWEYVDLKEIASKVNIKNRDNLVSVVLTNSATQGIVSQDSYFEREIVTESNLAGYYVVNIGDFVYNPRISATAPVGPIKMNELIQGVMSPLYTVFRFKKGLLKFYQYFFESSVWHDYMKSVANSGARHDRMNISGADFFALPVSQPIEAEQTKIAEFLSSIDEKISAKKAERDKLKTWKLGLLQQMFV